MSSFAHLHLHSQFSLLDGANRLDDVLAAAVSQGMPAMALTDHGNMFGAIEFYRRARQAGIKPIIGMEAYVAQGSHRDRDASRAKSNHLVLLARNESGYRNLIKLTSKSYLEGFYYRPRIDKELLREHSAGLIALSACLKGTVIQKILARQVEEAQSEAREMVEIFGEGNFYLEMQDHGITDQRDSNVVLRDIARRTGIPLVVSNDCHYLHREDAVAHDVLLCVGTQRTLSDPDRLRYASDEFYLKSADEMFALFPQDGAAVENTLAIAARCHLELQHSKFHLPEFPVPAGYTLDTYLEKVAWEGLELRVKELRRRRSAMLKEFSEEVYRERLRREIEVIIRMGFPGYFLIVWDFVRYATERGIPVGPGRGSAAGSLVAYALRITDVDPLEYDLLFERFLNPERVSLPDIDIDFCMRRRGEVIQYVSEKYGRDRVAQIITFGTLAAKAVVRDVGRVMGVPYAKVDRVAKLIPDMTRSLAEAVKSVAPLAQEIEQDAEVRQIVEVGSKLEGLTRHASLHAAGVVITPQPIDELVPLYKTSKGEIVTQWDKDVIEELGLLKMDFLGLRTLTVLDDATKLLALEGVELDLDELPLDDPKVYELFCDGRTNGVFQFESSGMKDLLRRAKPSRFEDLAAFNALYRPGALSVGMVEEYIQRKLGKKKVRYALPEVQPILEETYGVIAYQEQVMRIAVEVADFTLGEADVLRKAMGKKKPEVMVEQKEKFVDGAVRRGVAARKARELWDHIEPFAGYGFNKSHSVAYALLAYKTAYLKAHHPVAFMAAMLTSEMSSKDNVAKYIQECRDMQIAVLPPDINESNWSFTVIGETIRFGLGAVKGVGEAAVEAILAARREVGKFSSLPNLAANVDLKAVNRKVFECLVKAGAFDNLEDHRSALCAALDSILDFAARRQQEIAEGQGTLFAPGSIPEPTPDPDVSRWSDEERLHFEKETVGFYLTGHPLADFQDVLDGVVSHTTLQVKDGAEGSVVLGGVVARPRQTKIKSGPNAGRMMGRFVLEDMQSSVEVAVFADQLARFAHLLEEDSLVLVKGMVRARRGEVEISTEEISDLREAVKPRLTQVELLLGSELANGELLRLRDLIIEHAGEVPLSLRIRLPKEQSVAVQPENRFRVRYSPELTGSLESLLGKGSVKLHYGNRGPS